jgi:hypothetical protein
VRGPRRADERIRTADPFITRSTLEAGFPFVKVGRRTLFVQQALLEWIAAQTVPPRR